MRHEPLLHAPHDEPFRTLPGNGQASTEQHAPPAPAPVEYTPDGQPMVLAMAYVPMQVLNTLYDPEEGFCQGNHLPELNKPWLVGGLTVDEKTMRCRIHAYDFSILELGLF